MPYDIPLAPLNRVRSASKLRPNQRWTERSSANEVVPARTEYVRPIEPMLLVHQQQVETFRLLAAALRRGFKVLARPYAA